MQRECLAFVFVFGTALIWSRGQRWTLKVLDVLEKIVFFASSKCNIVFINSTRFLLSSAFTFGRFQLSVQLSFPHLSSLFSTPDQPKNEPRHECLSHKILSNNAHIKLYIPTKIIIDHRCLYSIIFKREESANIGSFFSVALL